MEMNHGSPAQMQMLRKATQSRLLTALRRSASPALLAVLSLAAALAQTAATPSLDAAGLVRRAVEHRIEADKTHQPVRYVLRRIDERRDTTKVIVETRDGDVARLIAVDGKALSADADRAELARLDFLAAHPEMQERRRKSEQKDAARIAHLLGLLPEAFLYRIEGTVACGGGECYRLSFTPNPHFTPPDLEADILRGVAGEAWIDRTQERLTRIDARFIADVDFGFGILGKLNKGGTALLEQSDVGVADAHDWELTGLKLHLTGKALLVKSLSIRTAEEATHFAPVPPNLTYRDAIDLLKKIDPAATPYTP